MAHDVHWYKPGRVLYANYIGHQSDETIRQCLDDMANHLDEATRPVFVLINWLEVTNVERNALKANRGHRAYSHPMAARGVLVGMDAAEAFDNEVSSVRTRGDKNTIYFSTMEQALDYLKVILAD